MAYIIEGHHTHHGHRWRVRAERDNPDDPITMVRTLVSKSDAIAVCHFMNGGSALSWKAIRAILDDAE